MLKRVHSITVAYYTNSANARTPVTKATLQSWVTLCIDWIYPELPRVQTSTGRQCFALYGSIVWNSLLYSLHDIRSEHILTCNEHHRSGIFVNLTSFTMFNPYLFTSESSSITIRYWQRRQMQRSTSCGIYTNTGV